MKCEKCGRVYWDIDFVDDLDLGICYPVQHKHVCDVE